MNMTLNLKPGTALLLLSLAATCLPATAQVQQPAGKDVNAATKKHLPQAIFSSPQDAVVGLVAAMRSNDWKLMHEILGHEASRYIQSNNAAADNEARDRFLQAYDEKSRIELKGPALAVLHVGKDEWPLPFPLVRQTGKWHFDSRTGIREWQDRRIGANELSAIQVALAYVDAQREFVEKEHKADGLLEYARHIVSTEGKHDGLYWPRAAGEPLSPMGQAFANADKSPDGIGKLESKPFHGYFFRILTAQGKSAAGGELNYLVKDKLIGGFGLIAYPASYGESGIKSFIVSHDGVVYGKDLGADSAAAAQAIASFDPDPSWKKEVK
jgi:hypothetical protein